MSGKGRGKAIPKAGDGATAITPNEEMQPIQHTDEGLDSRLTISNTDPAKRYFVYFIHESGRRGENMPIKVGACNDVGEYRKTLEAGRESNLKTYSALKCLKGDAEVVITAF